MKSSTSSLQNERSFREAEMSFFRCNKITQKNADFTVSFFYCLLFMNLHWFFQLLRQNVTVETKNAVICTKCLEIIDNLAANLQFFGIKLYDFHYFCKNNNTLTNKVCAYQEHHILVQMLHF